MFHWDNCKALNVPSNELRPPTDFYSCTTGVCSHVYVLCLNCPFQCCVYKSCVAGQSPLTPPSTVSNSSPCLPLSRPTSNPTPWPTRRGLACRASLTKTNRKNSKSYVLLTHRRTVVKAARSVSGCGRPSGLGSGLVGCLRLRLVGKLARDLDLSQAACWLARACRQ